MHNLDRKQGGFLTELLKKYLFGAGGRNNGYDIFNMENLVVVKKHSKESYSGDI